MFCFELHGRLVKKDLPERLALADSVQVAQLGETRNLRVIRHREKASEWRGRRVVGFYKN
jgi:hypothetical protein